MDTELCLVSDYLKTGELTTLSALVDLYQEEGRQELSWAREYLHSLQNPPECNCDGWMFSCSELLGTWEELSTRGCFRCRSYARLELFKLHCLDRLSKIAKGVRGD